MQEKLQWCFGLYDLNGDGLITKKEMLDVVTSIYEMLGHNTEPQVEENSAKEHVERIFHVRNKIVAIDIFVLYYLTDTMELKEILTTKLIG